MIMNSLFNIFGPKRRFEDWGNKAEVQQAGEQHDQAHHRQDDPTDTFDDEQANQRHNDPSYDADGATRH